MGQMIEDVRLAIKDKVPVELFNRIGLVPNPDEIYEAIRKAQEVKVSAKGYQRPLPGRKTLAFCPGCNHGIVHRLVAEVIDEMGLQKETVGVEFSGLRGVFLRIL